MSCCCSLKSSGVKTSSGRRTSSRKLPPEILVLGTPVVAIVISLECKFTQRRHRELPIVREKKAERVAGKITIDSRRSPLHPCRRRRTWSPCHSEPYDAGVRG